MIAVLGGGAGGAASAIELTQQGHEVRLWNRRPSTIQPHLVASAIQSIGLLGVGSTRISWIGTDLAQALSGADLAVVCLPALAHERLADELAAARWAGTLVLNPGHTGGALHFAARYAAAGEDTPPIIEFSTLTYVARKSAEGVVSVTGRVGAVRVALLPSRRPDANRRAQELVTLLWPTARTEADVMATSLSNVNLVLHPPAAILGAAWVEATNGGFLFYHEGTTPAVARVMAQLDAERLAVAAAYGHVLPPLLHEMEALGTVNDLEAIARANATDAAVIRAAVTSGTANAAIVAPESLEHRYYREDFAYGMLPFREFARAASVAVPIANSLYALADAALSGGVGTEGLTLSRLGVDSANIPSVLAAARGRKLKVVV